MRNPTQNVPKAAFPLELTLRTFVVYTQTKPGKLWDATRGPQDVRHVVELQVVADSHSCTCTRVSPRVWSKCWGLDELT